MLYDIFISHASEDKNDFVRDLATKLLQKRIEVWYDEFSLKLGDSLRQSIDKGLAQSRFGVVVLSRNFFSKNWTNWELDGLTARQLSSSNEQNLIIPIWHNITREEILAYSPPLADKVALISNENIDELVEKIDRTINPKGSTLLAAREHLLRNNFIPPVVTDDWWLKMIEDFGKYGKYRGFLAFPLVKEEELFFTEGLFAYPKDDPHFNGVYIGQYILQSNWLAEAWKNSISQLSSPDEVLDFISKVPGLKEAVVNYPIFAIKHFPQLSIPGMAGYLQEIITEGLNNIEEWDNPLFYKKEIQAYQTIRLYFGSEKVEFGYVSKQYDYIDCILWLFSSKSSWMPNDIRELLLNCMLIDGDWEFTANNGVSGYDEYKGLMGKLDKTFRSEYFSSLEFCGPELNRLDKDGYQILHDRFGYGIELLALKEDPVEMMKKFYDAGFPKQYYSTYESQKSDKK